MQIHVMSDRDLQSRSQQLDTHRPTYD